MKFVTVEFQRFGAAPGVLRTGERYLRTIGSTGETTEVSNPFAGAVYQRLMERLDYQWFFNAPPESEPELPRLIGQAKAGLSERIHQLLSPDDLRDSGDDQVQIDLVTDAAELAHIPFEVLEDECENFVITRRVRRSDLWPRTVYADGGRPRVLFAWSAAGGSVPHDDHKKELQLLVDRYGGELVTVPDATCQGIHEKLAAAHEAQEEFSHVHLLAHGEPFVAGEPYGALDLDAPAEPPFTIALGTWSAHESCQPADLADLFESYDWRPSAVTLAVCNGGAIETSRGGQSFAHAIHAAGVHVVVGSQFPLTKVGSIQLVQVFLASQFAGEDPREGIRQTRSVLRAKADETHHDAVAVVGYVHLDNYADIVGTTHHQLAASLAELRATTERLTDVAKREDGDLVTNALDLKKFRNDFRAVRSELEALYEAGSSMDVADQEECLGLIASAFKREAEALWKLAHNPSRTGSADELRVESWDRLSDACDAYRRAAEVSLDFHWVWTQWVVLTAVLEPQRFEDCDFGIRVAHASAARPAGPAEWAFGTQLELWVLVPAHDIFSEGDDTLEVLVQGLATKCAELQDNFPIESTLSQMRRYDSWWKHAPNGLDENVLERSERAVQALEAALT